MTGDDEHLDHFYGMYRGIVQSVDDPLAMSRIQVTIPVIHGDSILWALPCVPRGGVPIPNPNTAVWILFEQGDPESPVWMGVLPGVTN